MRKYRDSVLNYNHEYMLIQLIRFRRKLDSIKFARQLNEEDFVVFK
jgi:hypothetical protein